MPEAGKYNQHCYSNAEKVVLTDPGEDTSEGFGLHGGVNRSRGQRGVQAEQVSSKTGNVWGGHGSSGDGVGSAVVPGGDDVGTYDTGEMTFRTPKVFAYQEPRCRRQNRSWSRKPWRQRWWRHRR